MVDREPKPLFHFPQDAVPPPDNLRLYRAHLEIRDKLKIGEDLWRKVAYREDPASQHLRGTVMSLAQERVQGLPFSAHRALTIRNFMEKLAPGEYSMPFNEDALLELVYERAHRSEDEPSMLDMDWFTQES